MFIDGVPQVGNPLGIGTEDIKRAEVIKGPQYAAPLAGDRSGFAPAGMTYLGKRYDNTANFVYVPGQFRTHRRAGLRTDSCDVTVFVNHAFDHDTLEASRYNSDSAADPFFFPLAASEAVLPDKRQIAVTAAVKF